MRCTLAVTTGAVLLVARPVLPQAVPSQRELNGFLLGQHRQVLETQFGKPAQETRTPDGWVYRVFIIDSLHRAYMVFKFTDDRPDYIFSIQLAGDSGTAMTPFKTLALGDPKRAVAEVFGRPSAVDSAPDLPLERWRYGGRNYSFEFDPTGRLSSIQLFGFDGFPGEPLTPLPILGQLRAALLDRDVEWLMGLLAPDLEVYANGKAHGFRRAARIELSDSQADVTRLLLGEEHSVRAALQDSRVIEDADVALRVFERPNPGSVYAVWKLPTRSRLREIVFEGFAGEWRAWEIRFR